MRDCRERPTVVRDAWPTSSLVCEEVFWPVVTVIAADDLDEALAQVNASSFGRNTSMFTNDVGQALEYAKRVEAGSVLINVAPNFRADNMPYGGIKSSGQGREGLPYAIQDLTEPRLVVLAS